MPLRILLDDEDPSWDEGSDIDIAYAHSSHQGPNGKTVSLVTIHTGLYGNARSMRQLAALHEADIVILWTPMKHVLILATEESGIQMDQVAPIMARAEEIHRRNHDEEPSHVWQLRLKDNLLKTAQPTYMQPSELRSILRFALDPTYFEHKFQHDCSRGICNASRDTRCWHYDLHAPKCVEIQNRRRRLNGSRN